MSKAEVKETAGCRTTLAIEVEPERIDSQMRDTLRRVKRDVQIPGFRKGKAPDVIILKRFGDLIREEAVKDVIPTVLGEVFKEKGLDPVGDPQITELDFDGTGPLTFTVSVEELPEIDVSGFEGLEVTKEVREITDGDVDGYLGQIRQSRAEQVEVDREVRADDIITVNLQKLDSSGGAIIGEKMENQVLFLDGQGTPSPEFDAQVVGMKAGESRKVRFTYDESIGNPELVGTEDHYEVDLVKVVENRLPELDDEFARSVGDYSDLAGMRAKIRESLVSHSEMQAERKLQSDLVYEFVKAHPFEVPEAMVSRVIDSELASARQYSRGGAIDEDAFRERSRGQAIRSVQSYLISDAIRRNRGIEATKEEIDERLERIAGANGSTPREIRRELIKEGSFETMKNDIAQEKVYDWIKSVANITETTAAPAAPSNIVTP